MEHRECSTSSARFTGYRAAAWFTRCFLPSGTAHQSDGTAKPYYDEAGRIAGDRHQFKRRFQTQLINLGANLAKAGGVIMTGDWNVSRMAIDTRPRLRTEEPHARARAELNALLASHGFVDVWRERHANERQYTWFNRRARGLDAARVDYVLVSKDIVSRVTNAEILDLLPWSDHAPVMVEVDTAT